MKSPSTSHAPGEPLAHKPIGTPPASLPILDCGDVLLFSRTSFFNRIIQVKTWSRFTHVEIVGGVKDTLTRTYASRNGLGVGVYPADYQGLALVLRPCFPCGACAGPFDVLKARAWFYQNAVGQRYDWLGLLNFTYARYVGQDNHAMFCSEFATRFLREGGFDPFPANDADTISPRDFSVCPCLTVIWRSPDEAKRLELEPIV